MSTMLPAVLCPHCGHTLDHHTDAIQSGKAKPSPGDIGICVSCVSPLVFDDKLRLRAALIDELTTFPQELLERLIIAKLYRLHNPAKFPEETKQ